MDGYLWYGVVTTGVYCRPSCSSPAALPDNLRFFRSTEAARHAGFRACKRCHPDQLCAYPSWLIPAVDLLGKGQATGQVAAQLDLAAETLTRGLHQWLGVSPKALQQFCLTEAFLTAQSQGHGVLESAMLSQFGSEVSARRAVARWLGATPTEIGSEWVLSWGLAAMELGWLLVATSPKGVAFAAMGDTPGELLAQLAQRFPNARLAPMNELAGQALAELSDTFDTQQLPLDLQGTPFRMHIWKALQSIEPSAPIHYAELAQRVDSPKAARAVGSACAANPVCLSVPCHRVIPAGGGLGGYRWGTWRKAWLLAFEELNRT